MDEGAIMRESLHRESAICGWTTAPGRASLR
jgi:hypothetical protein